MELGSDAIPKSFRRKVSKLDRFPISYGNSCKFLAEARNKYFKFVSLPTELGSDLIVEEYIEKVSKLVRFPILSGKQNSDLSPE